VVTGGGRGIGAKIVERLASAGAHVTACGRDPDALRATAADVGASGGTVDTLVADVADAQDVAVLVERAAARTGSIDILVNNAGAAGPTAPLEQVSLEEWHETIAVNLTGVFLCCRAAIPYLRRARAATIVNLGSVSGKRPMVNRTPYTSAKLGVVGLSRTLAHELGPDDITVNVISPFFVAGGRLEAVLPPMAAKRGMEQEALRAEMAAETALKRTVPEDDVAALTLFLCSPAARSLTGQDFNVSAGAVMY